MKYMARWSISEGNFKAAVERFAAQNLQPPAGVKMLGRWHEVGTGDGFALIETDDPVGMAKFIMGWADLVDQKIYPVIEDDDVAKALGG